jgi:xylulokinase
MAFLLGIDVGTSGTKSLLMDAEANVLATATEEYDFERPRTGWTQQDPRLWWNATIQSVRAVIQKAGVDGAQIVGIGLSGQMHGLVITDGAGAPLRPSILWNDQRTAEQAAQIEAACGGRKGLIRLAGNAAMTSFTLTKLLWVRQHEPRIYDRIAHFLLPKDYVRLRLTGEYVGDVSDMSGTLMLDQQKRDWSGKIISLFELDRRMLPPVVESHQVTGKVSPAVAEELGIAAGTPVVGGGGDQPAGAVGNGVVRDGLTSATMGTSGVVFTHSRKYVVDPASRVNTFCSCVDGEYCMFGCVLSAGGSFQWFRNRLGACEVAEAREQGKDPYELLTAQAATAEPGCRGVFWLPYLTGERTPHADPVAKGGWIGIHADTTREELIRGVLEGVTFAMNDVVSILRDERKLPIRQVRLSGGGARSEFWRQLQADVYGTTCTTINTEQGPAYGVALLAAVGTGRFKNIRQACDQGIAISRTVKPDAKARKLYARHYAEFRRLYPALKAEFAEIARL